MYQEHFTDIAGPNFEGGSLPNDWEISSLNNGAYGSIDSHDGVCTITGASGSRFGVGCMAFENSDSKPYRVVSKINSYSGKMHCFISLLQSHMARFLILWNLELKTEH